MSGHQKGPIFVGGAGRSGTTLLRVMLDGHPHICCGPELKVLPAIAGWYQSLSQDFAAVMETYRNTPSDLRRQFRDFVEGLVSNYRHASGKPRWAEKTPHNVMFMLPLGEIFPDAQFIHVIRDGRDVACSLLTMNWINPVTRRKWDYVQNLASAARYWREVVLTARKTAATPLLAGRVLEVRYEAMVADPAGTMQNVLQFLGEPWDDAVLAYHTKQRANEPEEASSIQARRPINSSAVGRYKREMTPLDKQVFNTEAGELLMALGYSSRE